MRRSLIVGIVIAMGVFVIGAGILFRRHPRSSPPAPQTAGTSISSPSAPPSVFISRGGGRLAPLQVSPEGTERAARASQFPAASPYAPVVPEAVKRVGEAFSPPASRALPLPNIPDSELSVDAQGVRTARSFVSYFAAHSREISFESRSFMGALKNSEGVLLLPAELAEQALERGNFSEALPSLAVWENFTKAKLAFLKSIKVAGEAAEVNKKMIGFEKLTLQLIARASDAAAARTAAQELRAFLNEYRATADAEQARFAYEHQVGALEFGPGQKLMVALGLAAPAQAQQPPFGGPIVFINEYCSCSEPGQLAEFDRSYTPPPSGRLYVSQAFLSSPLFYLERAFHVGAVWLGTYIGGQSCFAYHGENCDFVGYGERVELAGTSR